MRLVGKSTVLGGTTVYVAEEKGYKFPIVEEALITERIFDQMISSGYTYCGYPFDFRIDGNSILDLPMIDYNPDYNELQSAMDTLSQGKLSNDELKKRISAESVTYITEPPTSYIINTREDFIKYLKTLESTIDDGIFYPINYFVSPEARFTIDEWKSGTYEDYFKIMENRRKFSYNTFQKLCDWLGVTEKDNMGDFLSAYYAWGIDGLNARFVARRVKESFVVDEYAGTVGNDVDAYELSLREDALVDRYGKIYVPKDVPAGYDGWKVGYKQGKESILFKNIIGGLREGEYAVIPVSTKTQEYILELETLQDTFRISTFLIKGAGMRMYNFFVTTPDITHTNLGARFWLPRYRQRVKDMSMLYAIAHSAILQRTFKADVSTYKALQEVGVDIYGALNYVVGKMAQSVEDAEDKSDVVIPTKQDIELYVNGDFDTGNLSESMQILDDIVNGKINADGVANGQLADKQISVNEIYKYLYCAHFTEMGMPCEEIYKSFENVNNTVKQYISVSGNEYPAVELTNGKFTVHVPCHEVRNTLDGYKADLRNYKVRMANECCGFLRVTQIAKEYGEPSCDRHVAFEAETVNIARDKNAQRLLNWLMDMFDEKLNQHVSPERRATLALYKKSFCMINYFSAATTALIRFTPELGGETVQIPMQKAVEFQRTITKKISSTAVYCRKLYESGCFTHFCVNADITPYRIYPKKGVKLPSAALPAVWYDLDKPNLEQIKMKLIRNGYIYPGFQAWTYRYADSMYYDTQYGELSNLNLTRYMMYCENFRSETKNTEEFKHAPHIESLLYPVLPQETVREDNGIELRSPGKIPSVTISEGQYIDEDTFKDYRKLKVERVQEEAAGIRAFSGFSARDFLMLKDITSTVIPYDRPGKIEVVEDTIYTNKERDLPYYHVERLMESNEYPIIRLYGRKYLLRDVQGVLWEVVL